MTEPPSGTATTARSVVILADDLIWATRLADAVIAAGAKPARIRRAEDLAASLGDGGDEGRGSAGTVGGAAIIDLTARAYDGVEAVRVATATGARVVAVGQHDDADLRRRAIEAGAERVFTYRALFEDGARLLARWLA